MVVLVERRILCRFIWDIEVECFLGSSYLEKSGIDKEGLVFRFIVKNILGVYLIGAFKS